MWCVIVQQLVPVLVFLFFLIFRDAWTRIVRLYILDTSCAVMWQGLEKEPLTRLELT